MSNIYTVSATAVMAAVLCIIAPLSLPVGAVPISFANVVIFLSLYLLGWKNGTLSVGIYILMGLIGFPVFSGFSGGIGALLGATGGYILGYLPMAVVAGIGIEFFEKKSLQFLAMVLGCGICYGFGTLWFCMMTKTTVAVALGICVLPFLPGDLIKMVFAVRVGRRLKRRFASAGIYA